MDSDQRTRQRSWARTYWTILINQTLVLGVIAFLATGMLRESYRACEAASLYLPGFTEWYFNIGPAGLAVAAFASLVVSLAVVALRRHFAATAVQSNPFRSWCV